MASYRWWINIFAGVLVALGLWLFVRSAQGDLVSRSRMIAAQVRNSEGGDPTVLHGRFRLPVDNSEGSIEQFVMLWRVLRRTQLKGADWGARREVPCVDGVRRPWQDVVLHLDGDALRGRLVLKWVQFQGTWYIGGFETPDGAPTVTNEPLARF